MVPPSLSIDSPLSGITNLTDFNSPSGSNHRNRNLTMLDTTLNSIDMLNFDYIENCSSAQDLRRIICLLSESKNKSPHLLKAAMNRLRMAEYNEVTSPHKGDTFAQGTANISRITTTNTTLDSFDPGNPSLNFSYSPSSTLHGIDLINDSKSTFFENGNRVVDHRLDPIAESPNVIEQRSRGREIAARVSSPSQSKAVFFAAQQIQNLKSSLREQCSNNEGLKVAICQATKEQQETKKTLDIARATLFKKDEEMKALEERLERRITELSSVLENTAERSKLVIEGERTFRRQCEDELQKENKKNTLLDEELKKTRNNLEKLQRRHSSFRVELLKITGLSKTERKSFSQEEFVVSLSNKIQKMKDDNDRMAKELEEAQKVIRGQGEVEAQLSDAIQLNQKLAIENQKLSRKVRELRVEINSSRAYIDKLLRTSNDTKEEDWEKHEQQYKQVIANLRKQIRKQGTVVSIDLYKAEKAKVRDKSTQLQAAENTINDLNAKVAGLQKEKGKLSVTECSTFGVDGRRISDKYTPKPLKKTEPQLPNAKLHLQPKPESALSGEEDDDLTGLMITFQKGPELNKTRRTRKPSSRSADCQSTNAINPQYSDGLKENKTRGFGEIAIEDHENKEIPSHGKNNSTENPKKKNGNFEFESYFDSNFEKENSNSGKENRMPSRGSPSRLVRNLGGRSALKNKIKKMRSPKIATSTASTQMKVILH